MSEIDSSSREFQAQFLQLQRSALIDTQTLFQLMIEKGICTVDEILETRESVEASNPDVSRIDKEIEAVTGQAPKVTVQQQSKTALMNQLRDLIQELNSAST